MEVPVLLMEGIEKHFPGVHALQQCRFELMAGEVHALIGENGAGKSTMMKIATGVYSLDAGSIRICGKEVQIPDTKAAQQLGISMIHQELNLLPHLTVAQNIFMGREPRKGWGIFLDEEALNRETQLLLDRLYMKLDPKALVSSLSVAKQQMVEIAKALSFQAQVLIMDEPTAALTDAEIQELFRIIIDLKQQGVGIIYISHRMEELKQISDRITVMRDGCYVDTVLTEAASIDQIIRMMVGRQLYSTGNIQVPDAHADCVLEVRNLSRGRELQDVSFQLRRGEIVGFAGLMGAGRTEVARAIFGADELDAGEIYMQGQRVHIRQPHDAVAQGIGYLSEDRKRYGLLVDMDVGENIGIASYARFMRFGWIRRKQLHAQANEHIHGLAIKTPHVQQVVKFLSGGNQQKVVIGKWLTRDCDVLIFDEPTRGIDVGAKNEIYKLLEQLAAAGKAILMISSELPEILRMSHRVLVMCEGRMTGELRGEEATQEAIMKLATQRAI